MRTKREHIALLAAVAFSTIVTELLVTKILSVIFWNHIVYLVISLALLGYGISSTLLIVFRKKVESFSETGFLTGNLVLLVITTVAALFLVNYVNEMSTTIAQTGAGLIMRATSLVLAYALFLPPFFFAGNILVFLFYLHPRSVSTLYFWDLTGASLGCVAFTPLIVKSGAYGGVIILLIMLSLVSIVFLYREHRRKKSFPYWYAAAMLLGVLLLCALYNKRDTAFPLGIDRTKSLGVALNPDVNGKVDHEYSAWDVVTRLDIVSNGDKPLDIGWSVIPPGIKLITFDGDAISQIASHSETFPDEDDIKEFVAKDIHVPFFDDVWGGDHLIIGLGGGPDIARSLILKARSITGVDINNAVLHAMRTAYARFSGNIFNRPAVALYHADGRSFLKHTRKKYDLIQMTGVDTFTALNSGAYVLAENYLYTVNALRDYFSSLSDNGIICIHRWFFDQKPRESLRLFAVALEALREEGVERPERHIAVIRAGSGVTFIKKRPFTDADIAAIQRTLPGRNGSPQIIYLPGTGSHSHPAAKYYATYVQKFKEGKTKAFYESYDYDVSPVTDDGPFFFNYYKLSNLFKKSYREVASTGPIRGYWAYIVFAIILLSALIAVAIFIFVPLYTFSREGLQAQGAVMAATYFLALGLGFIMIEITLMQKFALFLGHPMYSISTVLGGMLLFAGVGSYLSNRWVDYPRRLLRWALGCLAVMTAAMLVIAPKLIAHFIGHDIVLRICITIALVAPISIALGVFFPVGLTAVGKKSAEFIPWAWGINSGFTVIGSVVAIIAAMGLGFNAVLVLSFLIYLVGYYSFNRYTESTEGRNDDTDTVVR